MRRITMLVLAIGLLGPVAPIAHAADAWFAVHDRGFDVYQSLSPGDVVRFSWSSQNREPHTVTSYTGQPIDSGLRMTGEMDVTFEGARTAFRCELHSTLDEEGHCDGMCAVLEQDDEAPSPPVITAPLPGEVLGTTSVTIAGTSDPDARSIRISDGEWPRWVTPVDGSWSVGLFLTQGPHTLDVRAYDRYYNESEPSFVSFTVVDTTPPASPVFLEPSQDALVQRPFPVMLAVDEETSTVEFTSDDPPVSWVSSPSDGIISFSLQWEAGPHTLVATARDRAGNASGSVAVDFTVDARPPSVRVLQPSTAGLFVGPPLISGAAGDDNAVSSVGVKVIDRTRSTIDQFPAICTACGTEAATWELLAPLETGWYTVSAIATDAAGYQRESAAVHVLVL